MRKHSCSDTCDHRWCHLVPSIPLSFPYKVCTRACVCPALTAEQSMPCCGRGGGVCIHSRGCTGGLCRVVPARRGRIGNGFMDAWGAVCCVTLTKAIPILNLLFPSLKNILPPWLLIPSIPNTHTHTHTHTHKPIATVEV